MAQLGFRAVDYDTLVREYVTTLVRCVFGHYPPNPSVVAPSTSANPDADFNATLSFSGWCAEDFTQFRTQVAGSGQLHARLDAIKTAAQERGWCGRTTFRFATKDDAEVLHKLNRVNWSVRTPASSARCAPCGELALRNSRGNAYVCMCVCVGCLQYESPKDFKVSLHAKNEFTIVAELEGTIVAFVNYYMMWYLNRGLPQTRRRRPQKVLYVSTLQAVKLASHADLIAAGSTKPSERHTGTLLYALALEHARENLLVAALCDSTPPAVPYYKRVFRMTPRPCVRGTHPYQPMHLDLRCFNPLVAVTHHAVPAAAAAAPPQAGAVPTPTLTPAPTLTPTPTSGPVLEAATLVAPMAAQAANGTMPVDAPDEVSAQLQRLQAQLRSVMQDNLARATGLRGAVTRAADELAAAAPLEARRQELTQQFETVMKARAQELAQARQKNNEDMEAHCCVCGGDDSLHRNLIVICERCELGFHQQCYGVASIPEGDWFCEWCRSGCDPRGERTCELCPVVAKAGTDATFLSMRRTAEGRFVHQTCAEWHHAALSQDQDSKCVAGVGFAIAKSVEQRLVRSLACACAWVGVVVCPASPPVCVWVWLCVCVCALPLPVLRCV